MYILVGLGFHNVYLEVYPGQTPVIQPIVAHYFEFLVPDEKEFLAIRWAISLNKTFALFC